MKSAGLGARDTLRLEAAMNLYGNDMDESQNPLESGLAWTVSFENPARDFIGRKALEAMKAAGLAKKFVALLLEDRGVLRGHQKVIVAGQPDGRRRNHERHVLPDDGEIHRARARPPRHRRLRAGRHPRQTVERARRESPVRAQRQDTG